MWLRHCQHSHTSLACDEMTSPQRLGTNSWRCCFPFNNGPFATPVHDSFRLCFCKKYITFSRSPFFFVYLSMSRRTTAMASNSSPDGDVPPPKDGGKFLLFPRLSTRNNGYLEQTLQLRKSRRCSFPRKQAISV